MSEAETARRVREKLTGHYAYVEGLGSSECYAVIHDNRDCPGHYVSAHRWTVVVLLKRCNGTTFCPVCWKD